MISAKALQLAVDALCTHRLHLETMLSRGEVAGLEEHVKERMRAMDAARDEILAEMARREWEEDE